MLMHVAVKVHLSFPTSSPSLVFWGFVRAIILTNLFSEHSRHSSLKMLRQHSCFSTLFLRGLYVMYYPVFRDSKVERKRLERTFLTSLSTDFKILRFFFKITEMKMIQANLQLVGEEQKTCRWRNFIECTFHIRHCVNTYQYPDNPRAPAL